MATHSNTHYRHSTAKARQDRVLKTVEKYHGKVALAESWKELDPVYSRELQNEADALKRALEVKGVTV